MERIAVAGLTLHDTDLSGLERVRRPAVGEENAFLRCLSDELGASELVLLATCNRVEVIYAREEGDPPGAEDLDQLNKFLVTEKTDGPIPFVLRQGREAIQHLFRVTCSLDSLVLGEDQIIAQVRSAYGRSADIGLVGNLLAPLFHHALQIGKKVRSETELARHPVSVVNLAVQRLAQEQDAAQLCTAVVGAGEMGGLLARTLQTAGLAPTFLVNRSLDKAVGLAREVGAAAVSLESFLAGEHPVDVVVTATASPQVLFPAAGLGELARQCPGGGPLLGIDLAVPRNLPAEAGPGVEIMDLDALRSIADFNRGRRAEAAGEAEALVRDKLDRYVQRFNEEAAAPAVSELKQAAEEILVRELQSLLSGRLAHLDGQDRQAIQRWARATFGRLMHPSVTALKRMAADKVESPEEESL